MVEVLLCRSFWDNAALVLRALIQLQLGVCSVGPFNPLRWRLIHAALVDRMLVELGSACFLFVGRLGDVSCCHFVPSGVPKLQRWDKAHHVSNVDATLAQRGIGAYACNGW